MDIQIASDLHLELEWNSRCFEQYPLIPSADILVLAGDIMLLDDNFIRHCFWDRVSKDFEQVYFLPGNHEYYNGNDASSNMFGLDIRPNVHLINMEQSFIQIHLGIRFPDKIQTLNWINIFT